MVYSRASALQEHAFARTMGGMLSERGNICLPLLYEFCLKDIELAPIGYVCLSRRCVPPIMLTRWNSQASRIQKCILDFVMIKARNNMCMHNAVLINLTCCMSWSSHEVGDITASTVHAAFPH
jgi:hypothetical protein